MNIYKLLMIVWVLTLVNSPSFSQDISPLKDCHVWLPMTGVTEQQMDDARKAGFDTIMLKVHPSVSADLKTVDFASTDKRIEEATAKGFKVLLPILGWVGLGDGHFWDVEENGDLIKNQLDPFWPEAMGQLEWYYRQIIERYKANPRVVAFAPTWGIYGEAGFTTLSAGRSPKALARFNEWRAKQNIPPLDKLPTKQSGPNTEFNRFVRFRYIYLEQQFTSMIRRLKLHAGAIPVGMWQELYPIAGYLWTMVEVPSADFALYESCFPFQTIHHPEKSLGETMGFRYMCSSAEEYRNYYTPLLARKRGEGQRFMGCQLSNDYAVNYGWTEERAKEIGFDRWEDEFGPYLKKLLDAPLESPERDVLMIFPTYAAAALTDTAPHSVDGYFIDTILRMYGCQISRYASPRLDKMTIEDMNKFKLIVVPDAAFIMRDTYEKLKKSTAKVMFTGAFAQSLDGELVPFGQSRSVDNVALNYIERPAGKVSVALEDALTKGLARYIKKQPVSLDKDEAFGYESVSDGVKVLLKSDEEPLMSIWNNGKLIFIHGNLWAALCNNPNKPRQNFAGSKDASACEGDIWGNYDSSVPQNDFGCKVMKNILDFAGVDYRVPNPKPRTFTPYLRDHMEQASISANIVYNNTAKPQALTVRTPYQPAGYESRLVGGRYETRVTVPAFSYIALQGYGE